DVSVQATVLDLFRELQSRLGFAALFISHDLAVVDSLAHRIGVLFRGDLVEDGHGPDVLQRPSHEYTRKLIASLPVPDPVEQEKRRAAFRAEWGGEAASGRRGPGCPHGPGRTATAAAGRRGGAGAR